MEFEELKDQEYFCGFCRQKLKLYDYYFPSSNKDKIFTTWSCYNHVDIIIQYCGALIIESGEQYINELYIDFEKDVGIIANATTNSLIMKTYNHYYDHNKSNVYIDLPFYYLDLSPEQMWEKVHKLLVFS
jgi:hypothetical protein